MDMKKEEKRIQRIDLVVDQHSIKLTMEQLMEAANKIMSLLIEDYRLEPKDIPPVLGFVLKEAIDFKEFDEVHGATIQEMFRNIKNEMM